MNRRAAIESGYIEGTEVYAGSGDAGATTLGSGAVLPGELSINLGTSGWVAAVSDHPSDGVFNLAAIDRGRWINVIPVLNAAHVHRWLAGLLFPSDPERYDRFHSLLMDDSGSCRDLLCLPYLIGERFPVADDSVRGVFLGLDSSTRLADLARSALEGVAFSLKMATERLGIEVKRIAMTGGGAGEGIWNRIFADVFDAEVTVTGNPEYIPAAVLASAVLLHRGRIGSYSAFIPELLAREKQYVYLPSSDAVSHYRMLYDRFRRIYPAVKDLF